jgi:hypothetical protein
VTPNRTELLATGGLPNILAIANLLSAKKKTTILRHHSIRDRWSFPIDFGTHP